MQRKFIFVGSVVYITMQPSCTLLKCFEEIVRSTLTFETKQSYFSMEGFRLNNCWAFTKKMSIVRPEMKWKVMGQSFNIHLFLEIQQFALEKYH